MIDILLINPQPVVMKDLFAENLMYANPPLGLGYLASAARNAGYSVDLIDVGIDKLTISGIIHRIIEVDAQIVGISSFIDVYKRQAFIPTKTNCLILRG